MVMGCEIFQPPEVGVISDLDRQACDLLHDTLYVEVSTTVVDSLRTYWIDAQNSLIASLYDTLELATPLAVTYPITGEDTSYVFFMNDPADSDTGEVVFFFNDFLEMEVVRKDGEVFHYTSDIIPLETLADCYTGIKSRFAFVLETGHYLARFIRTEATQLPNRNWPSRHPRVAVLRSEES